MDQHKLICCGKQLQQAVINPNYDKSEKKNKYDNAMNSKFALFKYLDTNNMKMEKKKRIDGIEKAQDSLKRKSMIINAMVFLILSFVVMLLIIEIL